jgi:hypothetical protein
MYPERKAEMTTFMLDLPDHFPDEHASDEMIRATAKKHTDEVLKALGEKVVTLFDVLGAPKTMKMLAYAAAATGLDILADQLEAFAAGLEEDELDKAEAWTTAPLEDDFNDLGFMFSARIINIEPDDPEADDE